VNISGAFTTSNTLTGALTSSGMLTVGSLDLDGTDFNINQGFASADELTTLTIADAEVV